MELLGAFVVVVVGWVVGGAWGLPVAEDEICDGLAGGIRVADGAIGGADEAEGDVVEDAGGAVVIGLPSGLITFQIPPK